MYYLGLFRSSQKIITVEERMKELRKKEKNKKNEECKSDLKDIKKNKAIYISSKYKLNLFIF